MNYETVMNNIKSGYTVTITHVNEVVNGLLDACEEDEEQSWERLNELMEVLTAADIRTYNGNPDQYHNLAVSLARANQYGFACDVLKLGLKQKFSGEAQDLLADFLAYSIQCNRTDDDGKEEREAEACYEKLMAMDRSSLGWRAFDFSIDYLSARLRGTADTAARQQINARIDELLDGYQKYHPKDEKAYLAQYVVNTSRNERDAETKLQEQIQKLDGIAPRCTLKLAEHFFKLGRYEEAEEYIGRCKIFATTTEQAVEPGSIYTLSALCGMCRIYKEKIDVLREKEDFEKRVRSVYKDCEAAHAIYLKRRFREYRELEIQCKVLEKLSGIQYELEQDY